MKTPSKALMSSPQPAQSQFLQRAAVNSEPVSEVPPVVHEVLQSPGQPLDRETRAFMEPRFGHDFSRVKTNTSPTTMRLSLGAANDVYEQEANAVAERAIGMTTVLTGEHQDFSHVRVHSDAKAAESARTLDALAYTVGQDVVFGAEQYQPHTRAGSRLLAHELTHVMQQGEGTRAGFVQRQGMGDLRYAEACDDMISKIRATYSFRNLDQTKIAAIETTIADIRKQTGPDQYRPWPDQYRLLNKVLEGVREESHTVGPKNLPVKAYFFPGQTNRIAMIISGVHGSEVSGVEVVQNLLKSMGAKPPFFSVIIIPELFPDQVAREMAQKRKPGINSNTFRESGEKVKPTDKEEIPTNRNFPTPTGATPDDVRKNATSTTQDELGVPILKQNQILLELINRFKPERIASVHANRRATGMERGGPGSGVFVDPAQQGKAPTASDPRVEDTDADRDHPKTEEDRLAANIARRIVHGGGRAGGNFVDTTMGKDWRDRPVGQTRYDPKSTLHNKGQSLGTWGPKAGMTVITVEVPWYEHSSAYKEGKPRQDRLNEIQAYSASLEEIFLGP